MGRSRIRSLAVALFVLFALGFGAGQVHAQSWSLSTAQRQAYLQHYAPLILKRGDENDGKDGGDWLSNFDFDRDGDFSNNRVNWRNINLYVAAAQRGSGAYNHWRIRPTLYTALIEYMDGGSKSLVLLYHVYNATDKDRKEIHDWERVEIVVRGVNGTPGTGGEFVNHVTITHHKDHLIRRYYDTGLLNFMRTATGNHVLLWQADESDYDLPSAGPHAHELRFIKDPYSWIASQNAGGLQAKVRINDDGDNRRNLHYVFAPEGSEAAAAFWAKPLSYSTAAGLASRVDNGNTVYWSQVKRITYELQDLADIFRTHWQHDAWYIHWLSTDSVDVLLESPLLNEAGQPEVSAGLQRFYTQSRDIGKTSQTDGREGILSKNWFHGAYSAEFNADTPSGTDLFPGFEGFGLDSFGTSRGAASGYLNSHNSFWWQHDFFVHSGVMNSDDAREEGMWLRGAWYTPANGGFDGRWAQLFADRPEYEAPPQACPANAEQECLAVGGTWRPATCTCKILCPLC